MATSPSNSGRGEAKESERRNPSEGRKEKSMEWKEGMEGRKGGKKEGRKEGTKSKEEGRKIGRKA